jgi:hypothetical protein
MDIHSLSIVELKRLAKQKKIKQYYIMKRVQLITLLVLPELPEAYRVDKLTIRQLRVQAKEADISQIYKLNRLQLVQALYPDLTRGPKQEDEDDDGTEKHNDPKDRDPE